IFMIILIIIGAAFYIYQGKEDDKIGRLERNLEIEKMKVSTYVNKVGELTAEIESKSYTRKEMKEFEAETLKRIEEITGDVKGIKQYIKFRTKTKDTVFIKHDSIIHIVDNNGKAVDSLPFLYKDNYLSLTGKYTPKGTFLDYEYTSAFDVVASWKKPEGSGFLTPKRLMV